MNPKITLFSAIVAILFMIMIPMDAEAYYFNTAIYHQNQFHPESYENIDFTPSYDIDTQILTITFGENPDMNANNQPLKLEIYYADTVMFDNASILSEEIIYSDGLVISGFVQNDISDEAIIFAMFIRIDQITARAVANTLGLSQRMARNLLKDWVADGWLVVANPSNRARVYTLSAEYRQYIGMLSATPGE